METENNLELNTVNQNPADEVHAVTEEKPSHDITIFAEPVFHVGDFTITNSLLTSWLAVLIIIILGVSIRLKLKKIPGKLQHVFEVIVMGAMSLCDQVTNDRKITERIFPIVFSLFFFILINNWVGLLPFVSAIGFNEVVNGHQTFVPLFRAGTADLNFTLALALVMVLGSNIFGIMVVGIWKMINKYVNIGAIGSIVTKVKKDKSVLIVAPITFFVGILELIGEMAKIASLSFRLFGNIFAGEVLLAAMAGILIYVLPGPFLFLEVFVGLIQALIFSLLSAVYFTIAAQDHNEHEGEHGHHDDHKNENEMVPV